MEHLIPEPIAAEAFARLAHAFERAAANDPGCETSHYLFGGRPVRARVVGPTLAAHVLRPFQHLKHDGAPQDGAPAPPLRLDLSLWDVRATGVAAPDDEKPLLADEALTDISVDGRFVRQRLSHSVAALDRHTGRIVAAMDWSDDAGVYQRGKPLARLIAEWYADQSLGVMHAALVACEGSGVLLAGREGAGKSTLALACARAGLDFLGEDYAALELLDDGGVVGHSVYNSAFVTEESARWLPELAPHVIDSPTAVEDKSVVLLADVWPSRLQRSTPIDTLAVCRVAETERTCVRPVSRSEALLAVAPSSLLSVHGRRHQRNKSANE